ncbi:MAG: hypothetical protein HY714_04455 [Candidatus Omnitrophica bacterium]|nr:hypothetical protein [Candidatus Omnitrophota bacterium]
MKKHLPFILIFCFLAAYRFSLIDRGAMAIPDEMQYWEAGDALEKLIFDRDLRGGFSHLGGKTSLYGSTDKPGHITLRLVPMALQGAVWKLSGGVQERDPQTGMVKGGIHFRNPDFMKIPLGFNALLSLALLLVFYKITVLLFGAGPVAAVAALIYGLLANSNIYVRHILPYDPGLLFFMLALYQALKRREEQGGWPSFKTCICAGLITGYAFTVYPGYYVMPVLILSVLLLGPNRPVVSGLQIGRALAFGLSSLAVMSFYEISARIGGLTYFGNLLNLSQTQHGSFEEGFSYLPKYMAAVESFNGLFLMIFSASFFALFLLRRLGVPKTAAPATAPVFPWIAWIALAGFVFHAVRTLQGHWVFYGRVLHMYMPFMVWTALAAMLSLPWERMRRILVYGAAPVLSVLCFVSFAWSYQQVAYPMDVLYKLGINTGLVPPHRLVYESRPYIQFMSPPPRNFETGEPYTAEKDYTLVNFCFFYLLEGLDYKPYAPPPDAKLVYSGLHYNMYPAYIYEGGTMHERELLKRRNYRVSVYKHRTG